MEPLQAPLDFSWLRDRIVGADAIIETPFGERSILYADYTASGRCLDFIEDAIREHQQLYANTHTEDDETGRRMSMLLHEAENTIKKSVNAGEQYCLIACGDGATGGIYRLQQILGIALPPMTWRHLDKRLQQTLDTDAYRALMDDIERTRPVVFVGPYEHHSNEISWRSGFASVVEVGLDDQGGIDLDRLGRLLEAPEYQNRLRIGSFSAASNVSGMLSDVHQIAKLLHQHEALACFDYAASAPYVDINMNPSGCEVGADDSLDAIFISPHKFLGGPGSSGLLIFNEHIYHKSLTPSVAGGGTVSYVNRVEQDFFTDIEEREKAGTPGILQTLKGAMAFAVKDAAGTERIEARESQLMNRAFGRWKEKDAIEILGNQDPDRRVAIASFNINTGGDQYLHPKFVTALLNDLFGIQSRAGCACAGPYGHRLLNIDQGMSERYRDVIARGYSGFKPGWCRVGFHYTMDDAEADHLIEAVEFVADHGHQFLSQYSFDLVSGLWAHREAAPMTVDLFGAGQHAAQTLSADDRIAAYSANLKVARDWADRLGGEKSRGQHALPDELEKLRFFTLPLETEIISPDAGGAVVKPGLSNLFGLLKRHPDRTAPHQ